MGLFQFVRGIGAHLAVQKPVWACPRKPTDSSGSPEQSCTSQTCVSIPRIGPGSPAHHKFLSESSG
eukprot:945236-Lingulodinium_polyedra.AAC.1